jgi:hypothetical protein
MKMNSQILSVVGVLLMAGCGSILGRKLGLQGIDQALMAGFAVGVILLAQTPVIRLRQQLAKLENLLAAKSET